MNKFKTWPRFLGLKFAQFFGFDLVAENKQLQDNVFELKEENEQLKKQLSSQNLGYVEERELPPSFRRENNNLLIASDGTKYCWNCYNKIQGSEFRVLQGNEYHVSCRICGIGTQLKEYPQSNQKYDPLSDF